MVISDPPNSPTSDSVVWAAWFAELRNYLSSIGLTVPPAPFGTGVTDQSWIDYASKISNAIDGAPPVALGVPHTSPVWKSWYMEIANVLNG